MSEALDPAELAAAWLARGQPEKALDALGRVDGAALETPAPWLVRVSALADLDRWPEADGAARTALARFPEHLLLLRLAAAIARQLGEAGRAEQHLVAALRLAPAHVGLLCAYAELVAADGQLQKAEALVARAASFAPEADAVLQARWVLANLRGDDEAALAAARARLRRDPDDPHALGALAMEELHAGDTAKAGQLYGAALATDLRGQYDPQMALVLRLRKHPLWLPMWPIERFGMWKVTIAGILLVKGAHLVFPPLVVIGVGLTWIGYCVYTWVAPPLLRRHLRSVS